MATREQAQQKQLTRKQSYGSTVLYSLGNAAGLITYNVFNTYLTFFYADVMKLPATWVGRGWFLFGFWNAINDPIAGWLSDRTRSRFGRRRFYIRALAVPVSIAFALIWMPPLSVETHGATAVLLYFMIIISIYDILQSIITLNQDALFPELYQGIDARASAATIRQIIGFLGGGLAIAFSPTVYANLGWGALAILWGGTAAGLHLLSLLGIHEIPLPPASEEQSQFSETRQVLGNRIFHIVIGLNFVTRTILAVLVAILPFYTKYVLKIDEASTQNLLLALLTSASLSLIFWQRVFKRYGTRRTMMISLTLAIIFVTPLLVTADLTTTGIVLLFLGFMTGGTFLGPDLLFAELVDEDYVRTGLRREGIYRGLLGFVYRFPPALVGLLLLEFLSQAGYDANLSVAEQPERVAEVLRIFTVSGEGSAVLAGLILLFFYPLHGQRLADVQAKILTIDAVEDQE